MADKDEKKAKKKPASGQAEKPAKADKAERTDKAPKAAKAEKADKAAADGKSGKAEKLAAPREPEPKVPARLKVEFEQTIRGRLAEQFGHKNRMQIPALDKVVINMGIGEGVADRKKVESAAADLALIAGQKAVITKARKSIATYKLRDGQAIGCKVTLRKARMYEFLDRLINIALPRVRDFRGLNAQELRRARQLYARRSRSTSCSRRSTTTRLPMSGAWTSPYAPPRATMMRRARC